MGIKVSPEAFSTRNISIASVAVSFLGFSSCNSFIAFNPSGVAALSSPSILADTFINIEPKAGCPLGTPGNRRVKSGLIRRDSTATIPPRSPIFIKPSHKVRTPVNPNEISKAVRAEENEAFIMSVQMAVLPYTTVCTTATTKAMTKNAIQM